MSTLKAVNIQHPSSANVNAGTDTSGNFLMNSGYGSAATAYGCRAWVNFNGTGTVAIRASGNVTSITDGGVGIYTVNFTNAMPDANYSYNANAAGSAAYGKGSSATISSSSLLIYTQNTTGAAIDSDLVTVSIFR